MVIGGDHMRGLICIVISSTLALASAPLGSGATVAAPDCDMTVAFQQPDEGGTTRVYADSAARALLFVDDLKINTDGTRRSYSVQDFWGKSRALNNLCNAMKDACAGLSNAQLQARRELTQAAEAAGWPPGMLKDTRISESIIPFRQGKPCPAVDGFLVSATSLAKRNITDVCDISNYVDALTVPALVLPRNPPGGGFGFAARGAAIGDVAVAMTPGSNSVVYAVVGDTGPARQLGEASIALNGKLLGRTREPSNYDEVRGRGQYQGKGWSVPRAAVLIFPKTRDAANPYLTTDRIDAAAKQAFDAWGGLPRLKACIASYGQQ